ncbi:hypothetical protein [Amycolatopsis decaplanina]|uniref:hypothetical protein n=1 Tax=Amycolatopsis decaplanina TaxID=208441 RepID=UPI00126964C2|nr:hypothetical protein [Amycolatopsis decaplanina]
MSSAFGVPGWAWASAFGAVGCGEPSAFGAPGWAWASAFGADGWFVPSAGRPTCGCPSEEPVSPAFAVPGCAGPPAVVAGAWFGADCPAAAGRPFSPAPG